MDRLSESRSPKTRRHNESTKIYTTERPTVQTILIESQNSRSNASVASRPFRRSITHNPMAITTQKPIYTQMAETMRRARTLLSMNQSDLSEALEVARQSIAEIEQTRRYPSCKLVDRFVERFDVNLHVYNWARDPSNEEALPGLLGLVPLHIVRLYERRSINAAVRAGRSRPLPRKSSFDDLPSIHS